MLFKNVSASASQVSLDCAFLDTVGDSSTSCWTTQVLLQNQMVTFKLDTGAEVAAVSEATFKSLTEVVLKQPDRKLFGPTHQALEVVGEFRGKLSVGDNMYQGDIYVIRGLKNNLLGLSAITSLQLIRRICSIVTHQNVQQQFPKVFGGLGTFGEEYVIKLHDEATPHALYTPRNVPIPMREKVKKELDRMESMGVISKVLEPTPWCAGMVVVPKNLEM